MKIYFIDNLLAYFKEKWDIYYYLADFILSHIISQPEFYHNFNYPDYFSLEGKQGLKISFIDFISSVGNVSSEKNLSINTQYLNVVGRLVERGAPKVLFNDNYNCIVCPNCNVVFSINQDVDKKSIFEKIAISR